MNKENTKETTSFYLFKSVSIVDKYNFYEYLSVMLDSGVILSEALDSVNLKIKNPFFKEKINEIITYISSWDSFSKAMKKIPDLFDVSEISIIESWEFVWGLSESLSRLSENLRKSYELRQKIKWALTYPIIIFVFLFLAVLIVLTYVIPSITPLFASANVELPNATKALIFTSDFIRNNFMLIILFIITLVVFFFWYKNTVKWKENIDSFKLSIPLIWNVYKNYILAQVSSTLGSLIGSWVNVVKALNLVGRSSNNYVYEKLFLSVTQKVSKWEKIVDSMQEFDKENNYFPADFLQMLSVWEKTANLELVAKKINNQYTKEVNYSLNNLTKWIEPLAILIAWAFVLWFAFAIFWAILKVSQTVW